MSIRSTLKAIPQPPAKFLVGNLLDIGTDHVQELMNLAREYGPIYQLDLPGRHPFVIVSGFDLADELCDEKRFDKKIWTPLRYSHLHCTSCCTIQRYWQKHMLKLTACWVQVQLVCQRLPRSTA